MHRLAALKEDQMLVDQKDHVYQPELAYVEMV
jgi:hypothetical protein